MNTVEIQSKTATFPELSGPINNPFMGWVIHATDPTPDYESQLVFARVSWKELEPQKGTFEFAAFESKNNFNQWKSQNKKLILLFYMDWPSSDFNHKDIPEWLYQAIQGDGTFYRSPDGTVGGFGPNYANATLIQEHKRVLKAIADRYDDGEFLYMMKIGSIGQWGEMHTTYIRDISQPGAMAPVAYQNQYLQHYVDFFKNAKLSCRYPRQIAKDNKMGLHNDGFGHPTHTWEWFIDWFLYGYTDGLRNEQHPAMPDFWKYGPSGGEFIYWPGTQWVEDAHIEETMRMAEASYLSWLMELPRQYVPAGSSMERNMNRLLAKMGYRIRLSSITYPESIVKNQPANIQMTWSNTGLAPFYYNWPIELSLANSAGQIVFKRNLAVDIRTWIPGQYTLSYSLNVTDDLPTGTYGICVAILNPKNGNPGINLAMPGSRGDKRVVVGNVQLTGSSVPPDPPPDDNIYSSMKIYGSDGLTVYPNPMTSQFSVVVKDLSNNTVSNPKVIWSIDGNPAGLSVSQKGLVTMQPTVKVSSFVLRVTAAVGTLSTTKTVQVIGGTNPNPDPDPPTDPVDNVPYTVTIYGANSLKVYNAESTSKYNAVVRDHRGKELPGTAINWTIQSATQGVSVDNTGLVRLKPPISATSFVLAVQVRDYPSVRNTFTVSLYR